MPSSQREEGEKENQKARREMIVLFILSAKNWFGYYEFTILET